MWSQNRCKLLNIIFILFCFVQYSEGTDVYGSYLNALAKIVLNGIGYKMCIKRCAASSPLNCKSYSYNMYDKACSIYDEDTSTSTLVTGTDVWYGERPNIPATLKGPCGNSACLKTERCVVLRRNTTKCILNECDEPPTIDNAVVGPGKTTVTSTRTYQCVQGYTLSGTGSVICKASGNWTTPGFSCSLSSCGEPPVIANTQVSAGTNTYGSVRSYTCITGYQMGGNFIFNITCGSTWSASDFTCIIRDCGTPPLLTNGFRNYTTTTYQSSVLYACVNGYTLSGNGELIQCPQTGVWPTLTCTCNIKDCGTPPALSNGSPSYTTTTYQSTVTYSCNTNYVLSTTSASIICGATGIWPSLGFTCNLQDCGSPPGLANTNTASYSSTTINSKATYTCITGYTLTNGPGEITCINGPIWQTPSFSCVIKDCGTPPALSNGSPSYTTTTYQSTVTYSCNTNYVLSTTSASITCGATGVWPSLGFTCNLQDCGSPPGLANTNTASYSSTTINSKATYTCITGYTLTNGPGEITCINGPTWQTPIFSCVIKDCGTPPALSNGSPSYTTTTYQSTVTYSCNTNYVLSTTSASITCGATGVWPSLVFTCNLQACPSPPTVQRAIVTGSGNTPGSTRSYTCDDGYVASAGTTTITCGNDFTWSSISLTCGTCSPYAATYTMRLDRKFMPPVSFTASVSGSVVDGAYCQNACTQRTDFVCVAAYYRKSPSGYCIMRDIRIHDNPTYPGYYTADTTYDEYIRNCG